MNYDLPPDTYDRKPSPLEGFDYIDSGEVDNDGNRIFYKMPRPPYTPQDRGVNIVKCPTCKGSNTVRESPTFDPYPCPNKDFHK